jgi:hypothetical protein
MSRYSKNKSVSGITILAALIGAVCLSTIDPASAANIRLAWDPNVESDLAGYKVYYGTSPRVYGPPIIVGNSTSFTLTGLTAGTYYYASVTAYDTSNNESAYSNEVVGVPTQPPSRPINDFNGDGKTDIVWRHKTAGWNAVWLMNGTDWSSSVWLPGVADTNWEIVGTGDFNGDGKDDIVWRHKTSGMDAVWLMDGTAWSASAWLPSVPDPDCTIVGPK